MTKEITSDFFKLVLSRLDGCGYCKRSEYVYPARSEIDKDSPPDLEVLP